MGKILLSRVTQDLFLSVTLSVLNLLPVWRVLIFSSAEDQYFIPSHSPSSYVASILITIVLTTVFFIALQLLNKKNKPAKIGRFGIIIVALLNPLNFLRTTFEVLTVADIVGHPFIAGISFLTISLTALYFGFRFRNKLLISLQFFLLLFFPFALGVIVQAFWFIGIVEDAPKMNLITHEMSQRKLKVIWILFDAMDERLFTSEKVDRKYVDEFLKFRDSSIVFSHALKANGTTMANIPSMIIGRQVSKAEPVNSSSLRLWFEDNEPPVYWEAQPGVFHDVSARGLNASIVGFYHPYCRIFSGIVDRCISFNFRSPVHQDYPDIGTAIGEQARVLSPFYRNQNAIINFKTILSETKSLLDSRDIDLIFVHFPISHPPSIWDRDNSRFRSGLNMWSETDYLDNVALANNTLRELRLQLENAGIWESSAILINSDHGVSTFWSSKKADDRLSFVLKMPYQQHRVDFSHQIEGSLVRSLIEGIFSKKYSNVDQLIESLNNVPSKTEIGSTKPESTPSH